MLKEIYLGGQRIKLEPSMFINKGGEADIYEVNRQAVKIWKPVDHPDFVGDPGQQKAAEERIQIYPEKLKKMPKGLKNIPELITPTEFAVTRHDRVVGYSMPLIGDNEPIIRLSQKKFREGILDEEDVAKFFIALHKVVKNIHSNEVILGDFNDLNVLMEKPFDDHKVIVIDIDSAQWDKWLCRMFTDRFIDPLLCVNDTINLAKPYTKQSDWYAFAVMLMQSLLYTGPYGGIHVDPALRKLGLKFRMFRRITVFDDKNVKYPKSANPIDALPDDMLDVFHKMFVKDHRYDEFPVHILDRFLGGTIPFVRPVAPTYIEKIHGRVKAMQITKIIGQFVHAVVQNNMLRYAYYNGNDKFYDDTGKVIHNGKLTSDLRIKFSNGKTWVGYKDGHQGKFVEPTTNEIIYCDLFNRNIPTLDANVENIYWIQSGNLMRKTKLGPTSIGQVLPNQTVFWVGSQFGFGFYRAGELWMPFVFDDKGKWINDNVKLPKLSGQLIDASCVFSNHMAWFFTTTQEEGKKINRCHLISAKGESLSAAEATAYDDNWLSSIGGFAAAGNFLLKATDEGIVKIEYKNDIIEQTQEFPDTEPFVSDETKLLIGGNGVYAVNPQTIQLLQIR